MTKTILIGPTGFLGLSFLEYDANIIAVGRSAPMSHLTNIFFQIRDDDDFRALDQLEFDNVIFLIGSSDHKVLNCHPTLSLEKNVLALSKFLWYLREAKRSVKKIITFTTMLQYDTELMSLPCDESQPRNASINNYVLSKYVAELITEQHRDLFSIIDVRMTNVYGPTPLIRPDLVPSLVWSVLKRERASVWTKKPERDFIYVIDAIEAVFKLIDTDFSGPVNMGSGVGTTVGQITDIISELSGVQIIDEQLKVSGHMRYVQDISLLKSLTGWSPRYGIREGIEKTFWRMKEHYDNGTGPLQSVSQDNQNRF